MKCFTSRISIYLQHPFIYLQSFDCYELFTFFVDFIDKLATEMPVLKSIKCFQGKLHSHFNKKENLPIHKVEQASYFFGYQN